MYPLGLSFFALSSDYVKYLIDEFYILARFLRMSYTDYLNIPTYIRKYLIDKIIEDNTPKD
jgi:hypothetical protein